MSPDVEEVLATIVARQPIDGREVRSRQRIIVALGRLPRPFDRHSDPTHVTGSALVTGRRGVLLHKHKRLGIWLQPGGHLEEGESPWAAARREAEEETGLALQWAEPTSTPTLAHVDVHDGGLGHTHLDLRYLLTVTGDDAPQPREGESQEVRWFDWPTAIELADPGLVALVRDQRPS
jgi:8-oxo-dGTP pyrophosphatase MutT (NUDIX family)